METVEVIEISSIYNKITLILAQSSSSLLE
jgi:hypothetical protein